MFLVKGWCLRGADIGLPRRSSTWRLNSSNPISSIVYLRLMSVRMNLIVVIPGVLSIGPIPVISLNEHYGFSNFTDLFRRAESQQLTKTSVRLLTSVSHPHTTSNKNIEASQSPRFPVDDCNETNVVSIDICIIDRRNRNSDFEPINKLNCDMFLLSRKVSRPVKWLKVLNGIPSYLRLLPLTILKPDLTASVLSIRQHLPHDMLK